MGVYSELHCCTLHATLDSKAYVQYMAQVVIDSPMYCDYGAPFVPKRWPAQSRRFTGHTIDLLNHAIDLLIRDVDLPNRAVDFLT